MPDPQHSCHRCGSSTVSAGVMLCPACTMATVFDFERAPTPLLTDDFLANKFLIKESLGEGGFGTVYLAEQIDPIQRNVAVKIIKRGMDSEEVIIRFEAERQALALLDHPGIAKIYEAGTTSEGLPFFAMEFVDGLSITEHCETYNLSRNERLELFAHVCEAVQHAHQRGIIHRDLKPTNILVDSEGSPKIIDFGIAKATTNLLTEKTLLTEFHQFVGTPAYVSPEQAEMSGKEVDTRSDLYSLGALLYELLTGAPPFDDDHFRKAGLLEILRVIREDEPRKPSTCIANRLEPDLDWVVMCALEKDPDRRYSTALDFARDIRRFLSNEPVEASPPNTLYRFRKFTRRNRAAVIAATIAILSLISGTLVSSYGLFKAKEEARSARVQAQRANAVVHLIDDMFGSADPFLTRGSNYTVRQLLDDYSLEFEGKLDSEPEVELSFQHTIASAYMGLAEYASAERHFRRALALSIQLNHPNQKILQRHLGWSLRQQGHYQAALKELSTCPDADILLVEVHRLLGDHESSLALAKEARTKAISQRDFTILSMAFAEAKDYELANLFANRAYELALKQHGENSARLISPLATLASIAKKQNQDQLASTYTIQAKEIAQATLYDDHPARLFAETRAAETQIPAQRKSLTSALLNRVGDNPEAFTPILKLVTSLAQEEGTTKARDFLTNKLGIDYSQFTSGQPVTIDMAGSMIQRIMEEGRVPNYIPLIEQALLAARNVFSDNHIHVVELKRLLAYMYRWSQRYSESQKFSEEAIAFYRKKLGENHSTTIDSLYHLVETLWDQNKSADFLFKDLTRSNADTARVLEKLGSRYFQEGNFLVAQQFLDQSLSLRRNTHGNEHPETIRSLSLLGDLEVSQRWFRHRARGPQLIEAYELSRKVHGDGSLETAHCVRRISLDQGFLLGPQKTRQFCQDALERAKGSDASDQTLAVLSSALNGIEKNNQNYRTVADRKLNSFNVFKKNNQEKSEQAIESLRYSARAEIDLNETKTGTAQINEALKLAKETSGLSPDLICRLEIVDALKDLRLGKTKQAEEKLAALCKKCLLSGTLTSPAYSSLFREYYRTVWRGGDSARFWENLDRFEDEFATRIHKPEKVTTLLPRASRWSYFYSPIKDWEAPEFNRDLLSFRGHAPFTDHRIPKNTPLVNRGNTVYFRSYFNMSEPGKIEKLALRLTRWGGAKIYLNGVEIARHNLKEDADHTTFATTPEPGGQLRSFPIEASAEHLRKGRNVIAVEVHRDSAQSPIYFELKVEGLLRE